MLTACAALEFFCCFKGWQGQARCLSVKLCIICYHNPPAWTLLAGLDGRDNRCTRDILLALGGSCI
jgi:hypothetical protein